MKPDPKEIVPVPYRSLPCVLPVAARELRFSSRNAWSYYSRSAAAGVVIVMVWGILEGVVIGIVPTASAGSAIFTILSCLLFLFVSLEGAWFGADSLSREKREGTLGLVFLTALTPREIVFSKLVACGAGPFFMFLAVIPVPSLSFFLGGLNWPDYTRMMLALVNGLFVSLAVGLLISACSRNERRAIAAALICVIALILILPALGVMLWSFGEIRKSLAVECLAAPLLAFAPSTPVLAVLHPGNLIPARIGGISTYALSLALSHAIGWWFLTLAARVARATLQEELHVASPKSSPSVRKLSPVLVDRRPLAVRLAEWSVTRCYILYGGIVILIAAWGIGFNLTGPKSVNGLTIAASVLFLHWCLKLDLALQVTRAISDEKRTGALEILLTTPLDPEEIIRGRLLAVKRRFLRPVLSVILIDCCILVSAGGGASVTNQFEAFVVGVGFCAFLLFQLADLYTLSWCGLWLGYRHDAPGRALRQALVSVGLGPFLLMTVFVFGAVLTLGPESCKTPAFGAFAVGAWVLSVWMTNLSLCVRAIGGLRDEFRAIATNLESR